MINRNEEIITDEEGWADFTCNGKSISVWIPKEEFKKTKPEV